MGPVRVRVLANDTLSTVYVPAVFSVDDRNLIHQWVRDNPFALVITASNGEPVATHLPILLREEDGTDVLYGHMARANPQWRTLGSRALVVFSGPHGYVSPAWYKSSPNVPTWNYVAVHAIGEPELLDDSETTLDHLLDMVQTFDPHLAETHPESVDRENARRMLGGLVAFRMVVQRWEGKAKLNQNKTEADRLAVRERYLESEIPDERAMAALMATPA